ncbi:CAP domain-containing protein [Rhodobacteraceae bacterium DSL-40]|uniref:CAP domain-containing protein n=1 Tax=Amaricoccus sp. B4 TaxID=3368557 RepID=UPI000DAE0D7F
MLRAFHAVLALALLVLAACASSNGSPGIGEISPGDANAIRLRHLDAVNAARMQHDLPPVQLSAELNAAAETHARDMSIQGRAWHFGSDLTSPRERAFRAGYRGEIVGENISEGTDSDLVVLKTWLDFKDTRDVMLDPAARGLGLGWYRDATGKTWWVQVVGQ